MKTALSALIISVLLANSANADQNMGKQGINIDQVIASLKLESATATSLKTLMESHRSEQQAFRVQGQKVRERKQALLVKQRKALLMQGQKARERKQALRKQQRKTLLVLLGYEKLYMFEEIMHQNRP